MSTTTIKIPVRIPNASIQVVSFPTELGWMAVQASDNTLQRIWFGHETRQAIETAAEIELDSSEIDLKVQWQIAGGSLDRWIHPLQDYAAAEKVSFAKWKIETKHLTPFQKSIVERCRKIPRGKTLTYGELAESAGSPGAARAVGSVMSSNRVPIVVPCHRVVGANGSLGGYSSPRGLDMKKALLEMEGVL